MSTASLHARLIPLFDSLKQTQHLINRLSKLPSSPGSSSSDRDEGDARLELSSEIHQSLKEQEEDFELVRQEAEDLPDSSVWARRRGNITESLRETGKNDLASQIAKLSDDLKMYAHSCPRQQAFVQHYTDQLRLISARAQFRKAQLQAKRNAEAAQRKERQLLFAGIQEGSSTESTTGGYGRRKGQEAKTQEEILLGASNDVTAGLRRTHNLMSNELERSQFAHETLENSTRELATLTETYSSLDTLLSSSKSLVGTLIHSQKSDTWYLETAFYVLAITIGWLVFRRLIYGPGWWLLYFPLRTSWWIAASIVQVLLRPLATLSGAVGAKNQSTVLAQASESLSTSVLGTGSRAGIPTFPPDMSAPAMRVGGGGHGGKAEHAEQQPGGSGQPETLSDQIGKMAEQSQGVDDKQAEQGEKPQQQSEGTVLRERTAGDGPPNPKKRMWEEPIADGEHTNKPRDEL